MRQREVSIAGLLLLMFLGIRYVPQLGSGRTSSPPASEKGVTEKTSKGTEVQKPPSLPPVWEALCKLNPEYGTDEYVYSQLNHKPAAGTEGNLDPDCLQTLPPDTVVPILAAVADPVHTRLGLFTDRTIEAVQTAASEADYIPYVQGIPWPTPTTQTDQEQAQAKLKEADRRYPGVLIFRKSDGPDATRYRRYLAVFLVPETPTSGLDKEELFGAIRVISKLPGTQRTILLAGPTFSGSAVSLKDSAQELAMQSRSRVHCIQAFSGTVSNAAPWEFSDCGCQSKFEEIQDSDERALSAFAEGMKSMFYQKNQIAILSEEGTKYGRQHNNGSPNSDEFLLLHFPRGIANLRNDSDPLRTASSSSAETAQRLPMRWQDSHPQGDDDVPIYGAYQTSFSQETVLARLADILKTQDIKALGILASDPWDLTFLIHWFKQSSPNVRLFVREPDLLYLRTPDVGSVAGVLAINNYPLITETQLWRADQTAKTKIKTAARANRDLLTFASSSQEAQYQVFLELLEKLGLKASSQSSEVQSVKDWPHGRLWLAATGTNGYFPITLLEPDSSKGIGAHENPSWHALDVGMPPYSAILTWCFFALLGLLHATLLTFPAAVPESLKLEFDFADEQNPITPAKRLCHTIALLTILLAAVIAGSSFLFFFRSTDSMIRVGPLPIPVYPLISFAVFATEVLLLIKAYLIYTAAPFLPPRTFAEKPENNFAIPGVLLPMVRGRLRFGTVLVSIPLLCTAAWFIKIDIPSTPENAFLNMRDLHLSSGIAPMLPLLFLLAVGYIGIWVYLRRISSWESGTVEMPSRRMDRIFWSDCNHQVRLISRSMLRFAPKPWGRVLIAVVLNSFLIFRPLATAMDMLEPLPVRILVGLWFFLALLLLWSNWFRLISMWRELREILQRLEKLPLRSAFSRLPRESSLSLWGWSTSPASVLPLRQGVDTLRALMREDEQAVTRAARQELLEKISALNEHVDETPELNTETTEPLMTSIEQQRKPMQTESGEVETEQVMKMAVGSSMGPHGTITSSAYVSGVVTRTKFRIADPKEPSQAKRQTAGVTNRNLSSRNRREKKDNPARRELLHAARHAMSAVIDQLIVYLQEYWQRGDCPAASSPVLLKGSRRKTDSANRKFELAEDLIALRYYSYIRYVWTELRHLLFFLVTGFSLLFLALHTYAFRADQTIDWSLIALFLVLGSGVVWVLMQQERDALLSRLQRTNADEIGKNFYLDLLKYGALPILTLLGTQVPWISNSLLRWLQPSLEAFH